MRKLVFLSIALMFHVILYAQTSVPDSNFEQALIDLGYDTGPTDGVVPTANINTITILDVADKGILSLEGIEDFTLLETLNCSLNSIVTLDLQSNMNLTHVYCYYNSLTSLLLPNTNTLQQLEFYNNFLTGGIELSPYINLTFLRSYNNPSLGSLDVSNSPDLQYLYCHNNGLNTLDVTQNPDLEVLDCYNNNLMTLDVSNNLALWRLWCHSNNLTDLNVMLNTSLESLYCYLNDLTSLALPTTPTLTNLRCQANDLPSLDATGLSGLESLRCFNNPNMTTLLLPTTNTLTYIDCDTTDISSLDVSNLMNLNYLDVYFCYSLTNLVLPPTTTLQSLWAYSTGLSNLDFTNNTGLQNMDIANGNFATIDVSMLPNLVQFYCNENSLLTSLDISNGNNGILVTMWADDNPSLTCIQVDNEADANSRDPNDWRKDDGTANYSESCALSVDDFENTFTLYPNPVSNMLFVDSIENTKFTVIDLFGKEVLSGDLINGNNQLQVTNLNNGIYFIKLETAKGSTIKKILKY